MVILGTGNFWEGTFISELDIWTNKTERIKEAFVIEDMYISDHKINGITLNQGSQSYMIH